MLGVSAESSPLLQLPSDIQPNIYQRLFAVQDLANFALCSRSCRACINSSALWRTLFFKRFGPNAIEQPSESLSIPQIRRLYTRLSRNLVPATQIQGVPPGQYEVLWRTKKLGSYVGIASSEVNMSVKAHRVHPAEIGWQGDESQSVHRLSHFESFPVGVWFDISGGQVIVKEFCSVDARLWCHSGEWKRQLAWDYVQLIDMNAPAANVPSVHYLATPANAANSVATFAQEFWARVRNWTS